MNVVKKDQDNAGWQVASTLNNCSLTVRYVFKFWSWSILKFPLTMVYAFPLLTCPRPLRSCDCGSFVWQSFSPRLFHVFSKRGWSKKRMREREGSYGVRQPHRRLSRPNGYLRWAKLVFFVFIQQRIALPTLRVKITGLRVLSVSLRIECLGLHAWGYSPAIPIRVCAVQRDRDFRSSDLGRDIHFGDVFLTRGIIFWTRESS